MTETDYREISQEYARGGIRAVILLNSGAAVAVLSQLSSLMKHIDTSVIAFSILAFVMGSTLGGICWLTAFCSTRYVDRYQREQESTLEKADKFMVITGLLYLSSTGCFLVGCVSLTLAIF